MPDPKFMQKYVENLTKKIRDEEVNDIPSLELRLGRRLVDVQNQADKSLEDLRRMRDTIVQAQQRVEELQRDHIELSAKAAGVIEAMLSLKFGDELEKEKDSARDHNESEAKKLSSGGNDSDPQKPKRSKKKKRTKKAAKQPTA